MIACFPKWSVVFSAVAVTATAATNNILLVIADDYGTDASSLYNTSAAATLPPTPQIAALAANGVRFTNAYAYPVCSPTRSCILTGRYGFRTGTGDVFSAASGNALKASEFTLPDAFAAGGALGYQLKHFGKWHLSGGNLSPSTLGGWPNFAGSLGGEITSYNSWPKVVTNGTVQGTTSSTVTTYATTDVVNDAVSFINAQTSAGKPWFAWVAFNAPHTPFHLPSPTSLCSHYSSLSGTSADITAHPASYYNAAVEAMDTEIGRLLAAVDLAKTTVIFIGDNGTPGQVLQTPFPSGHGKDTLYEGGVRVPMIIRGPDVVSPGRTSDVLTHVVDLYSTILESAGIPVAATVPSGVVLDSQSLMPVLKNEVDARARLYSEQFDTAVPTTGGRMLRDDRYKIIRKATGVDEFYDLQADPYESTNLLAGGVAAMTSTRQGYYYRLRFNLGKYTAASAPVAGSAGLGAGGFSITVPQISGSAQSLWRCTDLAGGFWAPASAATVVASGANFIFTDPSPPSGSAFYSVVSETP